MENEPSLTVKICDAVTKYSMYALVFLMPIFFLPWTSDVLDFNKQALLTLLAFTGLFAWMLKVLISGNVTVNINKVHIFVGVLLLVSVLSTIFSVLQYGSLWGWPQVSSESLLTLIGLCIVYFLISNTFTKKDIWVSLLLFCGAGLLAQVFGLVQLFGLFILPFGFAKSAAFNTIGQIGGLAMFCILLLPLSIILLITSKKWAIKALCIANVAVTFIICLLTSYAFVWWLVLVSCALLLLVGTIKRNLFMGRWMFLPMFFLVVSLFFILLHPQIRWLPQLPTEVYISPKSNLSIDAKALKESPLFGSGPGTFAYDFAKHKDKIFNNGSLWSINFSAGFSKVFTLLATTGVLGVVALLVFMGSLVFYGFKRIVFSQEMQDSEDVALTMAVLIGFAVESIAFFLYNSGLTLDFAYFFFAAIGVALLFRNHKTSILQPSSLLTLGTMFAFTLVFIFGFGFLLLDAQRYVANVQYTRALGYLQSNNLEKGLPLMERAVGIDSGVDLYFNQLAQVYLASIQTEVNSKDSDDDKAKKVQILVANSLNAAKIATDLAPKNINNWSVRAAVYQNLIGAATDADTWAINSYGSAIDLDPNNPYLYLQRGVVQYQKKDYKSAQSDLEMATTLKADYSNAWYYLGLAYDQQNQNKKAIESFTTLLKLVPKEQVADVQKIVDNLTVGRHALDGLGQQKTPDTTPAVTPSSSSSVTPSDADASKLNPPKPKK